MLTITLFFLFIETFTVVSSQLVPPTIEAQYTNYTLAGRVVDNIHFPSIVATEFYTDGSGRTGLLINIYPAPINTTALPVMTPVSVTFALPSCRTGAPEILSEAPIDCAGGILKYGYNSIPSAFSSVPASQAATVNGNSANSLIAGTFFTPLDSGGNYIGSITYFPPPGCPTIGVPDFNVKIFIPGIPDVGDPMPIDYVTLPGINGVPDVILTTFGGGCTTQPRQGSTILFNANPVILPVCRASTPANFPALSPTWYSRMFGPPSPQTPININPSATGYQLRVDNLAPGLLVDFSILVTYLDGSTSSTTADTDFSNVLYFATSGKTPAFVSICYYNALTCTPTQVFAEVDLFELETCMCNQNLYCNGSTSTVVPLLEPIPRVNLPYFNSPVGFNNIPACAFLVNPAGNFSNPIMATTVTAVSVDRGGTAPLQFNWQLMGVPPSIAYIVTPTTSASIQLYFSTAGVYTLQHVVTGSDGYRAQCSQQITVTQGLPILCVNPLPATGSRYSIAVGQELVIDASCSTNPYGTPMTFGWSTFAYNTSLLPFTMSTTSEPDLTLTGSFPGLAVLFLNVTNQAIVAGVLSGSAWQAFYITVYSITPTPVPPGVPPFFTPLTPTCSFFPPAAPTPGVPFPPPALQPPVGTMPSTPNPPSTIGPAGTTPFSGFFGPDAAIPDYFIPLLTFFFFAVLLAVIGVYLYRYIKRRRRMLDGYAVNASGFSNRTRPQWLGPGEADDL